MLRAYAGAATALRATTTMLPWRKLGFAEDGLALIDQTLAQLTPAHDAPAHRGVPARLETGFVAANTSLGLPAMFKRQDRGARLLVELLADPRREQLPPGFRATVWLRAARRAPHTEQARELRQRVAASGTPQATGREAVAGTRPRIARHVCWSPRSTSHCMDRVPRGPAECPCAGHLTGLAARPGRHVDGSLHRTRCPTRSCGRRGTRLVRAQAAGRTLAAALPVLLAACHRRPAAGTGIAPFAAGPVVRPA